MNFREREYVCRGRTIRLRQPDGIVALRADPPAAGVHRSVAEADAEPAAAVGELPANDVAAFRSAGWSFVAPAAARSARGF